MATQTQQYAQIADFFNYGASAQFVNAPTLFTTNTTWAPLTLYPVGMLIDPTQAPPGIYYQATTGGQSGATAPNFPLTGTVADGTVVWTAQGYNFAASINAALLAASSEIDQGLRARFKLPLPLGSWGPDIIMKTCWIAAYIIANQRGYNPTDPAEDIFRIRYDSAAKWIKDVAANRLHPDISGVDSQGQGQPSPSAQPTLQSPNLVQPPNWDPGTRGTSVR